MTAADDLFDPIERDAAPEKSSNSGCWKWVVILGVFGGFCVLVCCGVGAWLGNRIKTGSTMATTPAEVDAVSQQVADMDMLPDFTGKTGISMNMLFMEMRVCDYQHIQGKGKLQLMEIKLNINAEDPQQQRQLEAELNKQRKNAGFKTLQVVATETREIEIRGQTATFTITAGKDVSSNTEYHQVEGSFRGKNGPAKLMIEVEDEIWDEEAVSALLESLN